FSSGRLENVEAVAELLRGEGIQVRISDGRSYQGKRRSNFSYRDDEQSGPQPAVWILDAEDQPRGRQLLRDAGLLDSTRVGESSYLPLSTLHVARDPAARKARSRTRMRIGLLVLIVVVSALIWFSRRGAETKQARTDAGKTTTVAAASAPPVNAAPVIIPQQADDLEIYRADVPTALAKLLIEREFKTAKAATACIAIDGADPSPQFIESLALGAARAFSRSDCPSADIWNISVSNYMTDGMGRGNVQLQSGAEKARIIEAERDGTQWEILSQR
ncbi:MAG: hypothetical protein M3R16_09160, partial [Pseudomonadota bacterium]|nr:hypothetical protein [Pseudomonadota bacterium]